MCGHLFRVSDNPWVKALLEQLGVQLERPLKSGNFYPASLVDGVLMADSSGQISSREGIWIANSGAAQLDTIAALS